MMDVVKELARFGLIHDRTDADEDGRMAFLHAAWPIGVALLLTEPQAHLLIQLLQYQGAATND